LEFHTARYIGTLSLSFGTRLHLSLGLLVRFGFYFNRSNQKGLLSSWKGEKLTWEHMKLMETIVANTCLTIVSVN